MLLPLAVHLISRRRRQRIEWAAMDFLLDSDKKNRNRSRLEEWLLLLLRILAVALAGIVAAVPQLPERLSDWFEGAPATHIVVLDDSYSMAELAESGVPWQIARKTVERLIARSEKVDSPVRLILYSDEITDRSYSKQSTPISSTEFVTESLQSSKLAVGPTAALLQVQQLIEDESLEGSRCYLTLLSDFQRNAHGNNEALVESLESLAEQTEGIVLAPCLVASKATENLTLSELSIEPGPRTIGVEATGKIRVTSSNESTIAKTTVDIFREQSLLTSLEVGPFDPSESLEVTFPLLIQSATSQLVRAKLPADSLVEDNERYLMLDLPSTREVLLVDGSYQGKEGIAFAAALAPQASIQTGWRPRLMKTKSIDSFGDLSTTAVICLLDVPRLGKQALQELSVYVKQGGGLLTVLGPQINRSFYNNQILKETGSTKEFALLPARLDLPTQAPWVDPGEAMLRVKEHPALRILSGQRNGFLPLVRIGMFHASEPIGPLTIPLKNRIENTTQSELFSEYAPEILIELNSGEPILMEHRFGLGRMMTLFTTATPQEKSLAWSNLATLPIFPVMVNEIAGWLAQNHTKPVNITVGDQPPRDAGINGWNLASHVDIAKWQTLRNETDKDKQSILDAGAYRITSTSNSGAANQQPTYFAANADPREGNLAKLSINELKRQFDSIVQVIPAEALFLESDNEQSWRPMQLVGMLLLAILILERLLATRCSHVRAVPSRAKGSAS